MKKIVLGLLVAAFAVTAFGKAEAQQGQPTGNCVCWGYDNSGYQRIGSFIVDDAPACQAKASGHLPPLMIDIVECNFVGG